MDEKKETAMAPAQAAQRVTPYAGLRAYLTSEGIQKELAKVLPADLPPERIIRQTLTIAQSNPAILSCTNISILGCMIRAAELGMELSGPLGQAYLVPRKNGKTRLLEACFELGYRGMISLAYNSPIVASISSRVVREDDFFTVSYGTNPGIEHIPSRDKVSQSTGYYAVVKFVNGGHDFEYMSKADMVAYVEKNTTEGPTWQKHFDAMGRKTALKQLLKRVPLSSAKTKKAQATFSPAMAIDDDIPEPEDVVSVEVIKEGEVEPAT